MPLLSDHAAAYLQGPCTLLLGFGRDEFSDTRKYARFKFLAVMIEGTQPANGPDDS